MLDGADPIWGTRSASVPAASLQCDSGGWDEADIPARNWLARGLPVARCAHAGDRTRRRVQEQPVRRLRGRTGARTACARACTRAARSGS